jgi:FMN phosphatase YigB (HAD superfamily)
MKAKRVAIVFDWDDLVLDTAVIKNRIADSLAAKGVSRELVLKTAAIAKDAKGYHPKIHGRMIIKEAGKVPGGVEGIARLVLKHHASGAKKLLFPDAVQTIRAAHKDGAPLYVLSAGHPITQNLKIGRSGLKRYFRKTHLVSVTGFDSAGATKAKVLLGIAKQHGKAIFLDDRPKTIEEIKRTKALKDRVLPILVWRKKEKPPEGLLTMRRLSWKQLQKIAIHNGFNTY